jgi:hypothetical protein
MFEAVCLVAKEEISEQAFLAAMVHLARKDQLMWGMISHLIPPAVQSSARIETRLSLSDARARLVQLGVPMPEIEGYFEVIDAADDNGDRTAN